MTLPGRILLLAPLLLTGFAGAQDPAVTGVNYAKIQMTFFPSDDTDDKSLASLVITGVYASYSPLINAAGTLIAADPFDACGHLVPPPNLGSKEFIFLARLNPNSTCTAMEQSLNAEQAGASGVLNMAPDGESNYIWILQVTQRDASMRLRDPQIPQVAVSGISGTRLNSALKKSGGTIRIETQEETEHKSLMVVDLAITIVCITVAVLVLMYAYRVGRSICITEEQFEQEMVNPELRDRLRARVSEILIADIPVSKYVPVIDEDLDSQGTHARVDCAICLDVMKAGEEVRNLSCDHFFHKVCIDPWLLEHHNCPLCKDDIITPRKSIALQEITESECDTHLNEIIEEGQEGLELQSVELFPHAGVDVVVNSTESGTNIASLRQNAFEWQHSAHSGEEERDDLGSNIYLQQSSSMEASSGGSRTLRSGISSETSSRRQDAV